MEMKSFTTGEMEVIGDVLRSAFLAVDQNLDPEFQKVNDEYWMGFLKTARPIMLVTSDGLTTISKAVFGNDMRRDFVLQLTSNFFFMWGADNDTRLALLKSLAYSVSSDMGVYLTKAPELRGAPKAVTDRMAMTNIAIEVLQSNPWLAVMIMATMFMSYRDFENKGKRGKKSAVE